MIRLCTGVTELHIALYLLGQLIGGPRRDRLAGTQVDTYRPEVRLGGEGERVLASSASQAMYHVSWMVVNCRVDVSVSVSVLEMHFDGWDGKPFEAPVGVAARHTSLTYILLMKRDQEMILLLIQVRNKLTSRSSMLWNLDKLFADRKVVTPRS